MLKQLRKNTKLVIWTVIFCFVLWVGFSVGVQFQKRGRIAGEVFGREVSFQEFDESLEAARIFAVPGEKAAEEPGLINVRAWQNVILSREAKRRKMDVTDEEVRGEILRLLAEQKIGNPDPEFYRRWLQNTFRETPVQFERQVRELLRIRKLMRQVGSDLAGAANEATGEKKTERFLKWNQELMARANFKDYLPRSGDSENPDATPPGP